MRNGFFRRLKDLDQYPQKVTLNYDGGMTEYKTYAGMIVTFIGMFAVFAYGLKQLMLMSDRQKIIVNSFYDFAEGASIAAEGYG